MLETAGQGVVSRSLLLVRLSLSCRIPRNKRQGEAGSEGGSILQCGDPKSNGEPKINPGWAAVSLNKYAKSLTNSQLI